jgi:hypothetical protein
MTVKLQGEVEAFFHDAQAGSGSEEGNDPESSVSE